MNKLLIIVFVVVTVNSQDTVEPLIERGSLRARLQKAYDRLEEFRNNSIGFLQNYLYNFEIDRLQTINSVVDQIVNDTWKMLFIASADEKNADHCYESMRIQLRDAVETVISELSKCADNEAVSVNAIAGKINIHLSSGRFLLMEVDRILIKCRDAVQMELCVARKLPLLNLSIYTFELIAVQLRSAGETLGTIKSLQDCSLQPLTTFNSTISTVRESTTQCIKNV